MKCSFLLLTLFSCLVSCKGKGPAEVSSTETRPRSTRDGEMGLDATSAQRFGGSMPQGGGESSGGTFVDTAPESWKAQAESMFRLKNYSFGTAGEVYISQSSGSVLENTNRWLGQFDAAKLDPSGLESLPKVDFLATKAHWVVAEGTFGGGMGKAPASGYALRGVIAEINGAIVTVKMIGPKAEVEAQESALREYAATLKMGE
jgi:hypothetical protein